VTLPGDVNAPSANRRDAAGQYSSTAQDLARGKRSEIDHLTVHRAAWRSAERRDARQPAAACDRQAD